MANDNKEDVVYYITLVVVPSCREFLSSKGLLGSKNNEQDNLCLENFKCSAVRSSPLLTFIDFRF